MTPAGQEALAALAPPYGLSVPGPIWGFDPSTLRLSGSAVFMNDRGESDIRVTTVSYSQAREIQHKLAAAEASVAKFCAQLVELKGPPAAIYLEQPFGGGDKPDKKTGKVLRPHPHSYYFVAIVMVVCGRFLPDVPLTLIGPMTWKQKALGAGRGHAKKEEIMAWARAVGYRGDLQDEADAMAIATAGAVIETL